MRAARKSPDAHAQTGCEIGGAGDEALRTASPQVHRRTGKYKTLPRKSLSEQLLDEAREVELSQSGIRKLPKNHSLLSKLVGKLTK